MKKNNSLIDNIRSAITHTDVGSLFNTDDNTLEDACKEYLIYKGYRVSNPVKRIIKITKLEHIIDTFYLLLQKEQPEVGQTRNKSRDYITAKRFLASRMVDGNISRREALNECVDIIYTVFKHYNDFNFNIPLFFGVFGQGEKFGWVTAKALNIIYKENKSRKDLEYKNKVETANIAGNDMSDLYDLDKILNDLGE